MQNNYKEPSLYPESNNEKIKNIYNYYNVPNIFETSGQPNEKQLILLANQGYEVIINLATELLIDGKFVKEDEILKLLKIKYIHIPVEFSQPTLLDFKKFVKYVKLYKDKKIWVQCKANMRVSAFVYKYRKDILLQEHNDIIDDMHFIWTPDKIWCSFLNI